MSVTAILNGYRRPKNLPLQIQAIKNQTVKPDQIWLWINHHEDFYKEPVDYDVDRIVKNDHNWKYFGRFALAMLAQTEFVALFDDDTVPGNRWLENCLETYSKQPCIIGGVGLQLNSEEFYMDHERFGWPSHNEDMTEVDLVGHAWFVNKSHLKLVWEEEPYTWETGEDIHLSAMAQLYGAIPTIVPPHPPLEKEMSSSLYGYELGVDDKTTSVTNQQEFFSLRDEYIQHYVKRGWKLVRKRN